MTAPTVAEVRLYIGERIPLNGAAEDTLFTDEELDSIIVRSGYFFYATLANAWNAKAGLLADLVDADEDGSVRKLSSLYEHARKQADRFEARAKVEDEYAYVDFRAGAVGFDAFPCPADEHTISLFSTDDANSIRTYPLYRFPAIKG